MNLQEWREQQQAGQVEELPSGLEVTLRTDYGLMDLVMGGGVPEELEPLVDDLVGGDGGAVTAANMGQMGGLINMLLEEAITGPDGLDVGELPATDRLYLFQIIAGADGPAAGVGTAPDGDGVRAEAE